MIRNNEIRGRRKGKKVEGEERRKKEKLRLKEVDIGESRSVNETDGEVGNLATKRTEVLKSLILA